MDELTNKIKSEVKKTVSKAIELRHKIHENPELSFKEFNTAELIKNRLNELQIKYRVMIAGTGVLAEIYGKKPSDGEVKTVLIRGDMDALPVSEQTGLEFSSKCDKVMHACGHDVHTSILLCCAETLMSMRDEFSGCVKLMFQPGEETSGGAEPMIKEGVLDNPKVNSCIALHVEPSLNIGQARFKAGAAYSSPDEFSVKIIGRGGHAAAPHECIDPIVISAQIITALQAIPSRMINPFEPAVLSVCSINGGSAYNIIPETAMFGGTARSFSEKTRNLFEKKIEETVKSICDIYGATYEYNFDRLFPPLINDEATINALSKSAENYLEKENIIIGGEPTAAGEDFAYLPLNVKNSALFWLGSTEAGAEKYPLHSEKFVASDCCIEYGTEIFLDYAIRFLQD